MLSTKRVVVFERVVVFVAVTGAFALGAPATAQYQSPGAAATPIEVTANGNALYDSQNLAFRPPSVTARVGQVVRWRNTDPVVPHTATEDHGLWNLSGSYGQTPANPPGFAPGTTVERAFEAGTSHYYCEVHPKQMHGVVAVPVELSLSSATAAAARRSPRARRHRARHKHPRRHRHPAPVVAPKPPSKEVVATWASAPPATGEVFDVQRRLGDGPWQDYIVGTGSVSTSFAAAAGSVWHVRARLRSADDRSRATDWSPDASIQA